MGCKDTVLPDPHLKNHPVKCLTYEKNTRKPYNENLSLFRALPVHLHGNEILEEETSKLFNLFFKKTSGTDSQNLRGVGMEDIATVENFDQADIFLYDIDIVDGPLIGELARRSVGKHSSTVRLLRYISHICHVSNINALFKAYRCPSCDAFIKKAYDLERYLTTCREKVKYVFQNNVYQLRETLFDKLDSFKIPDSDDQKLFKNMVIFGSEPICVQEDKFRVTRTSTWIGKDVRIPVSFSSNLIEQPIFSYNSNPEALVESFVDTLDRLATQQSANAIYVFGDWN